ncbi:hypothetical protein BDW72DRAFT_166287 [Aspergillus terricola var. indicus]
MLQGDNPSRATRGRSTVRTDHPASRRMASGNLGAKRAWPIPSLRPSTVPTTYHLVSRT